MKKEEQKCKIYWSSSEPIVIGRLDENNMPLDEIVINPGDEVPEEALKILREARRVLLLPRDSDYDRNQVKRWLDNDVLTKFENWSAESEL